MALKIRPLLKFLLIIAVSILLFGWLIRFHLKPLQAADQPCTYHVQAYEGLNLKRLSQELESTGLLGRIHGAFAPSRLFVLSVREPEDFFSHREFSLLASDDSTASILSQVKRHDLVCLKGHFIANPSPQKHILVESVSVLESEPTKAEFPPYQREAEIPGELFNQSYLIGKVHAVGEGGKILVIEYKDAVIPIFVESPTLTEKLFRGDLIRLSYRLQERPEQPTHLRLDLRAQKPLEVLDSLTQWHGQEKVLKGKLTKFPKSVQVAFDVYALEVETLGIKRYFTLVNFQDEQEFKKIRDKLAQIWEANLETASTGRNLLLNREVVLEVRGQVNMVSPQQANPQILLKSAEDIQPI